LSISRRNLIVAGAPLAASLICGSDKVASKAVLRQSVTVLRGKLRGKLYTPSDTLYDPARRGSGTTPVDDRFPAVVVQPDAPDDIARTLEFAHTHRLEVSIRSGGHDLLGASTTANGVLIDLCQMNSVNLDPATGVVRAGGGTRAGELTSVGAAHGLAPTLGMNPNVGVGGLTLGGGIGWLSGSYGATVDNLLAVDIVTADGRVIRADAQQNADLYWALRGGGGNFGVATAFTYKMQPVSQVLAGDLGYKTEPSKLLTFLREFLAESPDELDMGILFSLGPSPTAIIRLCWSGNPADGEKALRPLRAFAPAIIDNVKLQNYVSFANGSPRFDNMFLRGGEFDGLNDKVIEVFAGIVDKGGPKDCLVGVLHYMHGALCRTPPNSTPFIREPGHILYNVVAPWQGAARAQDKVDWALATAEALKAVNSQQIYVNYLSYEGEQYVKETFGPHYSPLQAIKRKYDPDNVFHNNRNIRA
jgi:FAD/FMN-containing dehydrogenase